MPYGKLAPLRRHPTLTPPNAYLCHSPYHPKTHALQPSYPARTAKSSSPPNSVASSAHPPAPSPKAPSWGTSSIRGPRSESARIQSGRPPAPPHHCSERRLSARWRPRRISKAPTSKEETYESSDPEHSNALPLCLRAACVLHALHSIDKFDAPLRKDTQPENIRVQPPQKGSTLRISSLLTSVRACVLGLGLKWGVQKAAVGQGS